MYENKNKNTILSEIFETFEGCFPINMLVRLNLNFF